MEIEFFGANCFRLKSKKTLIVIDDNLSAVGGKSIQSEKTVAFYTTLDLLDKSAKDKSRLVIDGPGEYEVGDLTVTGMQARSHMDKEEKKSATVYKFMYEGQTVTALGHLHPDISDELVEFISGTDVLLLPIGGNGYTLDPVGAASIIKEVEPSTIIPSQYDVKDLSYEVPAQSLPEFEQLPMVTLEPAQDSYKLENSSAEDASVVGRIIVLNIKK